MHLLHPEGLCIRPHSKGSSARDRTDTRCPEDTFCGTVFRTPYSEISGDEYWADDRLLPQLQGFDSFGGQSGAVTDDARIPQFLVHKYIHSI